MSSRPSRDRVYLRMAHDLAERSTCRRRRVGCILTDINGRVLSLGFNGVPSGFTHCLKEPCTDTLPESGKDLDSCRAIHAEQNALIRCQDFTQIHTCYTTTWPCLTCEKMLLNTSCKRIVYTSSYAHTPIWNRARVQINERES